MLFRSSPNTETKSNRPIGFEYLSDSSIYLDAACQSLRPQPVIDALTDYYTQYNACGGRVKYAWGRKVDEKVEQARTKVLQLLQLSPKSYEVSFTLNTTYGLNLLLQQLTKGSLNKVVTSHIEHNSVFLSTISLAKRWNVPRLVLDRASDGSLVYRLEEIKDAVIVVNAVSNIDGRQLLNIEQLIKDAHAANSVVIIDAAQAMAHHVELLQKTNADAVCFSAHKLYGASLGVVVARKEFLSSLEISFIGGGMVSDVMQDSYELLPGELYSRLEPGLQAWGEIIALGTALDWLEKVQPSQQSAESYMNQLSSELYSKLTDIPQLNIINRSPSPVISVYAETYDAHKLALFLSQANIMVRSGYFCAHHYLKEQQKLPPLLRFSLGLHSTSEDVQIATTTLNNILKGLS